MPLILVLGQRQEDFCSPAWWTKRVTGQPGLRTEKLWLKKPKKKKIKGKKPTCPGFKRLGRPFDVAPIPPSIQLQCHSSYVSVYINTHAYMQIRMPHSKGGEPAIRSQGIQRTLWNYYATPPKKTLISAAVVRALLHRTIPKPLHTLVILRTPHFKSSGRLFPRYKLCNGNPTISSLHYLVPRLTPIPLICLLLA